MNKIITLLLLFSFSNLISQNQAPEIEWKSVFGGSETDEANSILQTTDGGFIVVGKATSRGSDSEDFWVIKLDGEGNMEWEKTFGGIYKDVAHSIVECKNGSFVILGHSDTRENKFEIHDGFNFLVIKIDSRGNKKWERIYKKNGFNYPTSIIQTTDLGFVICGTSDEEGAWMMKLKRNGKKKWEKTFGGDFLSDRKFISGTHGVVQNQNKELVFAGWTSSKGAGGKDLWIIKLDKKGNKLWDIVYGGRNDDLARSIIQCKDGSYLVGGYKTSEKKGKDGWVIKLDHFGNKKWDFIWDKGYGGNNIITSMALCSDDGFAIAGGGNLLKITSDFRVMKLDKDGNKEWDKEYLKSETCGTTSIVETNDGGLAVAGFIEPEGSDYSDFLILKINSAKLKILFPKE